MKRTQLLTATIRTELFKPVKANAKHHLPFLEVISLQQFHNGANIGTISNVKDIKFTIQVLYDVFNKSIDLNFSDVNSFTGVLLTITDVKQMPSELRKVILDAIDEIVENRHMSVTDKMYLKCGRWVSEDDYRMIMSDVVNEVAKIVPTLFKVKLQDITDYNNDVRILDGTETLTCVSYPDKFRLMTTNTGISLTLSKCESSIMLSDDVTYQTEVTTRKSIQNLMINFAGKMQELLNDKS